MPSISSTHTVSIDIYFTHLLGDWGEMAGLKSGLDGLQERVERSAEKPVHVALCVAL